MRALTLLAVPFVVAVVAVAVSSATGAVKTRECMGLPVCVPIAGPWVVVPTAGASARPQTSFVLSCPKGFIVGGLDAELSSRAVDVSFDARLGAPVNPGVSTTRDAMFRATKTDGTAGRVSFRPHIGCVPAAGGGGPRPRTHVSFGLGAASVAVYPPGQAPVLRVKTVTLRPGATQHALALCARGERLVAGTRAYAFYADAPPPAALAARVSTTLAVAGRRAALTVRNTLGPGPSAIAQVVATCAGGGA